MLYALPPVLGDGGSGCERDTRGGEGGTFVGASDGRGKCNRSARGSAGDDGCLSGSGPSSAAAPRITMLGRRGEKDAWMDWSLENAS